jgi:hypothetical protein
MEGYVMNDRPDNASKSNTPKSNTPKSTRAPFSPVASLTAALLGVLVVQSPAFAQGAAEPQAMPPRTGEAPAIQAPAIKVPAISDEKIKAFAVAYLQVDKVRKDYTARIGTTADAGTKQKLQNEANQQMIKAVETSPGMSLNDYKTIITAAQSDPDVARKVQQNLQAAPSAPKAAD